MDLSSPEFTRQKVRGMLMVVLGSLGIVACIRAVCEPLSPNRTAHLMQVHEGLHPAYPAVFDSRAEPVDSECGVCFNLHRAFAREYMMEQCAALGIVAEQSSCAYTLSPSHDAGRGFGTSMFHFKGK